MRPADAAPLALVLEDEAILALAIEDLLLAEGFEVVRAHSEAEAEAVTAIDLALAVINLRLGANLAGRRVIERLRRIRPNLPVVVVTGYSRKAPEADLRGLGGPTVRLLKAADYVEFSRAVWDVMDRARAGSEPMGGRRRTDQPTPA